MDKRGISEVITTLIFILLAIIAIGIVWFIIMNIINDSKSQIGLDKINIDISIDKSKSVLDESEKIVYITLARGVGKADLSGIKFVLSNGSDAVSYYVEGTLDEMGVKRYEINYMNNLSNVDIVSVIPVFSKEGEVFDGNVEDEQRFDNGYSIPEGSCLSSEGERCNENIIESCSGGLWVEDTVCDTSLPYCYDDGTARCVACRTNSDCSSSLPLCYTVEDDHRCVFCIEDSDCPPGSVCDSSRNFCN